MSTPIASTSTAPRRPPTNRNRGVCRYFSTSRGCFAGNACKFMHVTANEPTGNGLLLSPYDANKVCRYYQQGYCRRAGACWFRHVMPDEAASTSAIPLKDIEPAVTSSAVDDDEDEVLCSICYEKPDEFGLLDACNHSFCKACIKGWRGPTGKSLDVLISQTNKTCPSCRTRSRFIIPSNRFPASAAEKEIIVANYKASMSRVDCRYFAASSERPFCPYGRDCFYRHLNADGTEHVFNQGVDVLMEQFKRQRQRLGMLRPRQPANPPAAAAAAAGMAANPANQASQQLASIADELDVATAAESFITSLRTIAAALLPTTGAAGGEEAGYRIGDGVVRMREEQVRVLESLFASVGARGRASVGTGAASAGGQAAAIIRPASAPPPVAEPSGSHAPSSEDEDEETYDPDLLIELQTALGALEARVRRAVGRLAADDAAAPSVNEQGANGPRDGQETRQGGSEEPAFESVD